jgi:hypothetical protein
LAILTGDDSDQIFVADTTMGGAGGGLNIVADDAGSADPGNDIVAVSGSDVAGEVGILTDSLDDVIILQDLTNFVGPPTGVSVDAGAGNDDILVNATGVGATTTPADMVFALGFGDDDLLLSEAAAGGLVVTGTLTVDGGGQFVEDRLDNNTTEAVVAADIENAAADLTGLDFDVSAELADLLADIAAACP